MIFKDRLIMGVQNLLGYGMMTRHHCEGWRWPVHVHIPRAIWEV